VSKKLEVIISGEMYEVRLDDEFATFVMQELEHSGVSLHHNNPLKSFFSAYLSAVKKLSAYEKGIETILSEIENIKQK